MKGQRLWGLGLVAFGGALLIGLPSLFVLVNAPCVERSNGKCTPTDPGSLVALLGVILAGVFLIGAFQLLLWGLILRLVGGPILGRRALEELQVSGLPATVTVQEVQRGYVRVNRDPAVKLLLWVQPLDGRPAYQVRTLQVLPWWALPRAGMQVPALVDPADPRRVVLRVTALAQG